MKKSIALIIVLILLFGSSCMAMPTQKKNETVYVNLDNYGKVNKINIYSKWLTNGASTVEDHTRYLTISNLTNREAYTKNGEAIVWNVEGNKNFAYTGEVGEEYYNLIPWNFDISYKLNGVEVSPDKLLGAQGLVKITIDINSNKEANTYYQNNYVLEITSTYNMSEYLSVESEEAMITDTGNSRTLMFVILPGQSTTINIEIGSNDFYMDGITMALVPVTGNILDQIVNIVEDREDIEDAFDSINSSADIILGAMGGMTSGLSGVTTGVNEIRQGNTNLHELGDLRDEDIASLKTILEELSPLISRIQKDLDNLNKNYTIIIELDEKLNKELKNLSNNVHNLNSDLDSVYKVMKDLPDDVEDINSLIRLTGNVVRDTDSVVTALSGLSGTSQQELATALNGIATDTQSIGQIAGAKAQTTTGETQAAFAQIGGHASNIGTNLTSVNNILTQMSDNSLSGTDALQTSLNQLKNKLYDISEIMNKKDAQKLVNLIGSIKSASKTLEKMINIAAEYNSKLLANKDDFTLAINNMKQIASEIEKANTLATSMVTNLQSMLNILSNEMYNGTQKTTEALLSVNSELINMTAQSNQLKQSKDNIRNIIDKKKSEIEEKTTIFNLEKNAKVVSFGSEENENVESVQFVLKTPNIKNVKLNNEELEKQKEQKSFWDKIVFIFQKIFNWITSLFN